MKKKFNITPDKCRFVVNRENRTVVCILDNTKKFFIDFADENFIISPLTIYLGDRKSRIVEKKCTMPNRFYGIARCSENDEWNEETGKSIAFSRMKDKFNHSFFKRCKTYINLVDDILDEMVYLVNDVGAKLSFNTEKRHAYIDGLIGEESNGDENS